MKVAQIIDCYTVAITRRPNPIDQVYEGEVYSIGTEVIDPETGEELGLYPRLRVVVTDVQDKFFIAETYRQVNPRRLDGREELSITVNIGDEVRWHSSSRG